MIWNAKRLVKKTNITFASAKVLYNLLIFCFQSLVEAKIKHTAGSCFALSNKLSYEKDKQEIAHKNSRLMNNCNEYKLAEVE